MAGRKYCLTFLADWFSELLLQDSSQSTRIYLKIVQQLTHPDCYEDVWVVSVYGQGGKSKDLAIRYLQAKRIMRKVCELEGIDGMPTQLPCTYCTVLKHYLVKKRMAPELEQVIGKVLSSFRRPKFEASAEGRHSVLNIVKFDDSGAEAPFSLSCVIDKEWFYDDIFDYTDTVHLDIHNDIEDGSLVVRATGSIELKEVVSPHPTGVGIFIDHLQNIIKLAEEPLMLNFDSDPYTSISVLLSVAHELGRRRELELCLNSRFVDIRDFSRESESLKRLLLHLNPRVASSYGGLGSDKDETLPKDCKLCSEAVVEDYVSVYKQPSSPNNPNCQLCAKGLADDDSSFSDIGRSCTSSSDDGSATDDNTSSDSDDGSSSENSSDDESSESNPSSDSSDDSETSSDSDDCNLSVGSSDDSDECSPSESSSSDSADESDGDNEEKAAGEPASSTSSVSSFAEIDSICLASLNISD